MDLCFEKGHYCTHVKSMELLDPNLICYLIEGLNKNENVHCYSDRFDSKNILTLLNWTKNQKAQILKALKCGQFQIFSAEKVYLDNGFFNLKDRLQDAEVAIADSLKKGYTGLRIVGEMQWIKKAQNENISELVVEYESLCNSFFDSGNLTCFCVYCDEFLPPDICFKNLLSHPQVHAIDSVDGSILTNPWLNFSEDKAVHIKNMDAWLRYLRSLGLQWMARVQVTTKNKFKIKMYDDLIQYLEKDRFSLKGIPELFLILSVLLES